MSLTIRVLHDRSAFSTLCAVWNRLVLLEGGGVQGLDVSATFEWSEAVWNAFPAHAPRCILLAEDASGLVRGLLPCVVTPATMARVPHRQLTPATGLYDLRTGLLVGGDAEVATALLRYALQHVPGWDALKVRFVVGGASEAALEMAVSRLGLGSRELRRWRTPYIELPSDLAAASETTGTTRLRANVRRAERQLQKRGTLGMQIAEHASDVEPFLALMNEVESRSWKMAAGTAMVGVEQQQQLYRAVMTTLAPHGRWIGAALQLDGRPIAFICGFAHDGVFVDEKESYDDAFKDQGPGNVLKLRFLPELVRRGIRIHDYGGEEDPHKARWTDLRYERRQLLIHRSTPRGLFLRAALAMRERGRSVAQPTATEALAPVVMAPTLLVQNFEPGAVVLPPPQVAALPVLRWAWLRNATWMRGSAYDLIAPNQGLRSYARSRYALTEAYRRCGVGPDAPLLAPAYHCLTMIDPALRLGAGVLLYPLRPDLAPDLEQLELLITGALQRPAAMLLTHYFGFVQDPAPFHALCERHGMALIEDCSHAFSGLRSQGLGSTGRYSVWSPYKFHPCSDGGELQANAGASLPSTPPGPALPGSWAQVRALGHAVKGLLSTRPTLDTEAIASALAAIAADSVGNGVESRRAYGAPSHNYVAADELQVALPSSRWIIAHTHAAKLSAERRRRFEQWLEAVRDLSGCRPLYPQLPVGTVPYMFPLVVDEPRLHFMPLKRLGLPIWRWDNMALPLGVPECKVSQAYRLAVFQLPCHQELTDRDMDWMMAALRSRLAAIETPAAAQAANADSP